jgi:hypothetical protein
LLADVPLLGGLGVATKPLDGRRRSRLWNGLRSGVMVYNSRDFVSIAAKKRFARSRPFDLDNDVSIL